MNPENYLINKNDESWELRDQQTFNPECLKVMQIKMLLHLEASQSAGQRWWHME